MASMKPGMESPSMSADWAWLSTEMTRPEKGYRFAAAGFARWHEKRDEAARRVMMRAIGEMRRLYWFTL